MERNRWLPDRATVVVIAGVLLFAVLALGVLPRWLRARERADLGGVTRQTATGTVAMVNISPVSQGGGGLFNAVNVAFAGHQAYYALPPSSHWLPKDGDKVTVVYRQGRQSGLIHVDCVVPQAAP